MEGAGLMLSYLATAIQPAGRHVWSATTLLAVEIKIRQLPWSSSPMQIKIETSIIRSSVHSMRPGA